MCWPSGKEARIPARVFRASAPQVSDAVIADFMSHLLPENNWSELNILNSVSKAFIKTRGYGLEFRVRPGLEFRLPAAYINSICHHLKGGEHVLPIWQNCWEDIAWHVLNAQENLATTIIPTKPFLPSRTFLYTPRKASFPPSPFTLIATYQIQLFMESYSGSSLILPLFAGRMGASWLWETHSLHWVRPRLCGASPLTPIWAWSCSINSLLRPVIFYL